MYMYIPQGFLRHDVRGVGFWKKKGGREGGVRQMGKERTEREGSKRVGCGRNYAKKLNTLQSKKGLEHPTHPPPPPNLAQV